MEDRKVIRYLLYAIGEIFLVVIGILIAVQVNNWKQQRAREVKEVALLYGLKSDLIDIYSDLRNDLVALELGQESHFELRELMANDDEYREELCFAFGWLVYDDYIYPNGTAFEKIKREGADIISNEELRDLMVTAYETRFPRITVKASFYPDINAYFDDYLVAHFLPNEDYDLSYEQEFPDFTLTYPLERESGSSIYPTTFGYVPKDFEALKRDPEFKMLMTKAQQFRRYKIKLYLRAADAIEQCLVLINEELGIDR